MLTYFPTAYSGELFYSLVARYGIHTGILDEKGITSDVFGVKTAAAVTDFPSHLQSFCDNVKHVWNITPEEIIQNHTLMPAFLPFVSPQLADKTVQSAISDYGGNIHTRLGTAASAVNFPRQLRICEQCYKEQCTLFGEPYWQREHQLFGVVYCPHHHCMLKNTDTTYRSTSKHGFKSVLHAESADQLSSISFKHKDQRNLASLSESFDELLHIQIETKITLWQWTQFYRGLAVDAGLIKGTRVDHIMVSERMLTHFSAELLRELNSQISTYPQGWLLNQFRKHRQAIHPLRHLLIWQLFRPTFTVKAILEEAMSYSEIPCVSIKSAGLQAVEVDLNHYKKLWLALISRYPRQGVKALREKRYGSRIYSWLYRHDREWLMLFSPTRRVIEQKNLRVNWKKRDRTFVRALIKIKNYHQNDISGKRKSQAWYISHISQQVTLEKNLHKLPLCRFFLTKYTETIEQYQLRRIYRVVDGLYNSDQPIKPWIIMRKAGLKKDKLSHCVKEYLDQIEDIVSHEIPRRF